MLATVVGTLAQLEPDPLAPPMRDGVPLEDWEITPGLVGFLATFAAAVAVVLLVLSFAKHVRKADAYARAHGIEVPEREGIPFRREDRATADSAASASPAGAEDGADHSAGDAVPDEAASGGPGAASPDGEARPVR